MTNRFRQLVGPLVFVACVLAVASVAHADIAPPPPELRGVKLPYGGAVLIAGLFLSGAMGLFSYRLAKRRGRRYPLAGALALSAIPLIVSLAVASYCARRWGEYQVEVANWRSPSVSRRPQWEDGFLPSRRTSAVEPKSLADLDPVVSLLELVLEADPESARKSLIAITEKVQNRELSSADVETLKGKLATILQPVTAGPKSGPLYVDAVVLLASCQHGWGAAKAIEIAQDDSATEEQRLAAMQALGSINSAPLLPLAASAIAGRSSRGNPTNLSPEFRKGAVAALARIEHRETGPVLLGAYSAAEPELRPALIDALLRRPEWATLLLAHAANGDFPPPALNATQLLQLSQYHDAELDRLIAKTYGAVRTERNPDRERVIGEMRTLLAKTPGEAERGQAVFHKLCGQCHKIHGQGEDVGPDLTSNGRASYEQLLSNVFDPSLVIGGSYQARTLITDNGRVLTGLVVEDNDQRVVLKVQGGKQETVAREHVEEMKVSPLSLMPEGVEKQYTPEELADLFAFLTLDKPPTDPTAVKIPGTPGGQ